LKSILRSDNLLDRGTKKLNEFADSSVGYTKPFDGTKAKGYTVLSRKKLLSCFCLWRLFLHAGVAAVHQSGLGVMRRMN